MSATSATTRSGGLELTRLVASLVWVTAATAATLAGLGALPGLLVGEPRDVRRVASVEEAERRLGASLVIPAYFPSRLAWPPAEVRVVGGKGGAAAITFAARDGRGPPVVLLQAVVPGAPIPAPLLDEAGELSASRAAVAARPAVLARVLVDGATWDELRWERDGRAMVLRTRGEVDELYRMAHSVHRRGAP
jgi:hypothetical protein